MMTLKLFIDLVVSFHTSKPKVFFSTSRAFLDVPISSVYMLRIAVPAALPLIPI